jgi:Flp pilus assembly protein TadD
MSDVNAMYDEANRLKNAGDVDAAIAKWKEILTIDDKHVLSHMALSIQLQRQHKPDEAILHARRVAEIEPNDPFSFTHLSVIYQRCGRIPEAEDAKARSHMLQGRH